MKCTMLLFSASFSLLCLCLTMINLLSLLSFGIIRLEKALRHFATLTTGEVTFAQQPQAMISKTFSNQVIMIQYNDKNFYFNVLEVKPDGPTRAISVIETDLEVDCVARDCR